ncbi:MAG: hypothetical protein GXO60_02720 [Epsilonproteobacteria bacterium]|nr:hypothetical protein [Campylobacterota bacterium]
MKLLFNFLIFTILTLLTQIGGVIFLLSLWISRLCKKEFIFKSLFIFLALYLVATFFIVPFVAPIFNRIPVSDKLEPTSYLTILLNRNYVNLKLNRVLIKTQKYLSNTNIKVKYLDASFPFIDGFPLLPHLSHNDGKKIDISFIYQNKNEVITNQKKSISGYGVFVPIKKGEYNQTKYCKAKGYFQYDYPKYLTLGKINSELIFSEKGTKKLIDAILKNREIGKLFIEPNLKKRLKLRNKRVKNHGCHAVRHDDHIHIQLY